MLKIISKLFFRLSGWKIEGGIPPEIKKCVMVAAPHTSNYDFPIARAVFYILDIHVKYLIKKESMIFPVGALLAASGAIGVDRSKQNNVVDSMVDIINETEEIVMLLSPEGTRKLVPKWKTGFYYAAVKAKVPIVLSYLDYEKKVGGIGIVIYPTGDIVSDMQLIREYYRNIVPKHPQNTCLDII